MENNPILSIQTSSPELGKLFEALSKAQGEMKPAELDCINQFYKRPDGTMHRYASLASVMTAIKEPFKNSSLSISQQVFSKKGRYYCRTLLGHSSGEWLSTTFQLILSKNDMQGLGSAITYAKRYAVAALTGVVDSDDDDGNAAVGKTAAPASPNQTNSKPPNKAPQSQAQAKAQSTGPKQAPKAAPPPANKPPEAEDIPQVPPADEFQDQSKPENKKGPGDYIIAYGSPKYDGKKVSQLSEGELREMNTWIQGQLKRVPPPKNLSLLFDTATSIRLFFESMDLKL